MEVRLLSRSEAMVLLGSGKKCTKETEKLVLTLVTGGK